MSVPKKKKRVKERKKMELSKFLWQAEKQFQHINKFLTIPEDTAKGMVEKQNVCNVTKRNETNAREHLFNKFATTVSETMSLSRRPRRGPLPFGPTPTARMRIPHPL